LFFHANHESKDNKTAHIQKLNECIIHVSTDPKTLIIILDASVKNNVSTSITHIHLFLNPIKKMIHHAVNVTSMEAELFTIRCGINQAV